MGSNISAETHPSIVWLRRDLRLQDNPALFAAQQQGGPVYLVYVYEDSQTLRRTGGATKWWLDKSLRALTKDVEKLGGRLILKRGDAELELIKLSEQTNARSVFWNRRYGGAEREIDAAVKKSLQAKQIHVESFNGSVLTEPWTQKTGSGGYYKVFTPYWKNVRKTYTPLIAHQAPSLLNDPTGVESDTLSDWGWHPSSPDWSTGFNDIWTPGEVGAHTRLARFIEHGLSNYSEDRNRPDLDVGTSGLSPHLAAGEIGPAQIWRAVKDQIDAGTVNEDAAWTFLSEVVWRDFAYVLLFHNPNLASENYNRNFDRMAWRDSPRDLGAWQSGQTGYPIVDAGMRQLWQTGWMHNRVRMIVASFLTKHLLIPWQRGEDWFWDTLIDADPASNSASWQWTAGSGADAAPYFRVFNPITQGEKFDATGNYVRTWCPELAELPRKHMYAPWEANPQTLEDAGVRLGTDYPMPLVAHKQGRDRALGAYNSLKEKRDQA
ncbi:MAG: deoxyribodipyrimidine photo-lyase [Pseudomonadota bacterium]